jgi:uncharacterized membrane protein YbhN (UPF0104 family)
VLVEDHLERRIRKPADLLRGILTSIEIVALAVAGVAAGATMSGAEVDIVGASERVPSALLNTVRPLAVFALLLWPIALAIRQLVRRQLRRLAEAVATGVLTIILVEVANVLLRRSFATPLYDAIMMSRPGATHAVPLNGWLAGLVAYATMIGLSGRPRWRNTLWLAVGIYALVQLAGSSTTILALLITLLSGRLVGFGVRYAAGSMSQRPAASQIAAALSIAGNRVTEIRRDWVAGPGSRRYSAVTGGGCRLDIDVFDRDQQAAGAFYRLYRWVRLQGQVSRSAPLSSDRAVERRALLSYAGADAGVPAPRLRALVRVGPEAAALAYDHHDGTTLAQREPTDAELRRMWDVVRLLHAHRVTHRALTADRMLLTPGGNVMLLDLGSGDVAASDLQIRLDMAQLIAEFTLLVGPDRAADLAVERIGAGELVAVVPLLQPVALARSTRASLGHRREVLPALRKRLLAAVPGGEVTPVRLERIRLRNLVTLVASVAAVYLLAGELARESLGHVLRSANWSWGIAGLALSLLTYVGATFSLSGFVTARLPFLRTLLAQLAGSFVTLVTPAAVGGAALNVRYLQRRKVPAPVAVASVGVSQVVAFVLHILLLVVFLAITGTSAGSAIKPPIWSYFVLAGLVVAALAVFSIPAGRRLLRARVAPMLGQVLPRLLEVAQQPRKLAKGIGGALLLSGAYILCLAACALAFGGHVSVASIAVVYLTGSALGSIMPTPGGLGAVEAALSAGLTAAGMPGAAAVSSVLLFRMLTFWLPVPAGWAAMNYLEREQAL